MLEKYEIFLVYNYFRENAHNFQKKEEIRKVDQGNWELALYVIYVYYVIGSLRFTEEEGRSGVAL